MSYTALYRKFRPEKFSDVKGQDAIVTTLSNQIEYDRIGHAYLFCGTRGTGKTTVAKIFARAINCEHPTSDGPCGECDSCRAISGGQSMNVIEIDAASNNGVDNVREIRDEVAYAPTEGRYKVYIIDEVHMLSGSAFNALLKTLEEPPSYVVFILATTEPHKLPATILSRCQRYDFKRISTDTIVDRMKELLSEEKVEAEESALKYIARAADGGMRDALSILDQCIAFYPGETISYEHVLEILGAVDTSVFHRMFTALINYDAAQSISVIDEVVNNGRDLQQFISDFTWHLRNLLLVANSGDDLKDLPGISDETAEELKEYAHMTSPDSLIRYIRQISELTNEIRFTSDPRVRTEVAFIKFCRPEGGNDVESLRARIEKLENLISQMSGGNCADEDSVKDAVASVVQNMIRKGELKAASAEDTERSEEPEVKLKPELPMAVPEDVEKAVREFRSIVRDMPGYWNARFESVNLSLSGNGNLLMVFPNGSGGAEFMKRYKKDVEDYISEKIGAVIHIDAEEMTDDRSFNDVFVNLEERINFDIVTEIMED